MPLAKLLQETFFKLVEIRLKTKGVLTGYLIGIRLPVREIIVLYYAQEKHIDKYLKNQNPRWIEVLPYELVNKVYVLPQNNIDKEELLKAIITQKDITFK